MDTNRPPISVLWFKKDLRCRDHQPFQQAIASGLPLVMVYFLEPSLEQHPDWDIRHWQFQYHALQALNEELATYNARVVLLYCDVETGFLSLLEHFDIRQVFSYEETGLRITYDRDLHMQVFFKERGILWHEYPHNGVIRGKRDRKDWDTSWVNTMQAPQHHPKLHLLQTLPFEAQIQFWLPFSLKTALEHYPEDFQPPGERKAWLYLKSFVEKRVEGYNRNISSPAASRWSCGRISPYITWGNLSVRQVYQYYEKMLQASPYRFQLKSFRSRLQWRCHFIQKLEMEERLEFESINRAYLSLHQPLHDVHLQAWKDGKTGYPLIDASMRCVRQTGYLNFRMRALLVSFLTHLLWQPWQQGVYHLAQLFLDYEPGIHFYQFQMQAGVTGINTVRIYNPVKQSYERDPEGEFIKKWLPELKHLPLKYLHEPWKMTGLEQTMYACTLGKEYPYPIIEIQKAASRAREVLYGMKKLPEVRKEAKRILKRHVKPPNQATD